MEVIKANTLTSREDFATAISKSWRETVEGVINTGKILIAAKAALKHGEFGRMFEGREVPFSASTGRMLMAVASHPVISKRDHGNDLPPSWRTLYELTKVPEAKLAGWLKDGTIHADTQRKEITGLIRHGGSSMADGDQNAQTTKVKATNRGAIDDPQVGRVVYRELLADPLVSATAAQAAVQRETGIVLGQTMVKIILHRERGRLEGEGRLGPKEEYTQSKNGKKPIKPSKKLPKFTERSHRTVTQRIGSSLASIEGLADQLEPYPQRISIELQKTISPDEFLKWKRVARASIQTLRVFIRGLEQIEERTK